MKRFFGDSARAFGTLSVVLVLLLAVVPAKDYFREWRHYQHEYLKMVRGRADGPALARRMKSGVQQAWQPELGVTDRCTTCHVALKETTLTDVKVQPFRPHPPMPHSLTEFGCVACHGGQGVATTVESAHYSTLDWEQSILPARYSTASCGKCHSQPVKGAPQLNNGRALLASNGCANCHAIRMPDGKTIKATDQAPPLTHVAAKSSREWIFAWLKNPQGYSTTSTMPNFQLSDPDARDVSAYLIAQSAAFETGVSAPVTPDDDLQKGSSVYGESYCASCHAIQNAAGLLVGGTLGPELSGIGTKAKTEWLAAWLLNPQTYNPTTAMPHYRFNDKQIALLMGFMGSKTAPDFTANVHLDPATTGQIQHGKALVSDLGCAACHQINGVAQPDNFGPDLTEVGGRRLARLQFAPGVSRTLPEYISAKIRQPRAFGGGLKMPQYTFTQTQVDALTTALLAQTERVQNIPVSLPISAPPPSTYHAGGKAGALMEDMRCFSCHRINGRGGDMAPDLTLEGSSVQRAWLVKFLKEPNTLRPALIRRMPQFNMTDAEANSLSDYMMTAYQTPEFSSDPADASRRTSGDAGRGKDLYYGKYACNACHILDAKVDKGYIGPTLSAVGSRLSAPWIYSWLKNAQTLRPGVLEPTWNMSDEDAKAITTFLMTQVGHK